MNREQNNETENIETNEEVKETLHQLSEPTVKSFHRWKQRGTQICCDLCQTPHGFYVNVEDMLTGIDDQGNPIITKKY